MVDSIRLDSLPSQEEKTNVRDTAPGLGNTTQFARRGGDRLLNRNVEVPVPELLISATQRLRARPGSALTEEEIQSLYPAMRQTGYRWSGTRYATYNSIRIQRRSA